MADDPNVRAVEARLIQATTEGETLEVILVVRGRVRQVGKGRWRIRTSDDRVLTFRAESVVAATPVVRRRAAGGE